jgi:ATP-dependent DNA ligase
LKEKPPNSPNAPTVFAHACRLGLEGIVSKRKDTTYRSGRSLAWLKLKNPAAPAVKREAEEEWGKKGVDLRSASRRHEKRRDNLR